MSFQAANHPVFGIPGYFFFAELGFVFATSVFIVLIAKNSYQLSVNIRILAISFVFLLISARITGCLSGVFRDLGNGTGLSVESLTKTGIVFYGGLLGFIASYRFFALRLEQDLHILDLLAVVIPLFHALARIGCFFGGCCYGIENHGKLSVLYTNSVFGTMETVQRIPIQLIEASYNLILFVYLLTVALSPNWQSRKILKQYLILYSFGRFFFEYLRGDTVRGVICGISFSQTISLLILLILVVHPCIKKLLLKEDQ